MIRPSGATMLIAPMILLLYTAGPLSVSIVSAQDAVNDSVELKRDVSPPLPDLPPSLPGAVPRRISHLRRSQMDIGPALQFDPALQTLSGPLVGTTPGFNFDGLGRNFIGQSAVPPDPNLSVGAYHVVEWVNLSYAVYNKGTGAVVYGPTNGNVIWRGFGGPCETSNDGDPIVLYDKVANRWVMTQFVATSPYMQCIAVSPDERGPVPGVTFFRYAISMPNFADYPKLGVWPDAYYMSFNLFSSPNRPRICAFDRNSMLTGGPSNPQCTNLSSSYFWLLPSDLDGATPPPVNADNYFLSLGANNQSLDMWRVNFIPGGSLSVTGPINITVDPFNRACGGDFACVPQAGTTTVLNSLGDAMMHRLAYRNFGT